MRIFSRRLAVVFFICLVLACQLSLVAGAGRNGQSGRNPQNVNNLGRSLVYLNRGLKRTGSMLRSGLIESFYAYSHQHIMDAFDSFFCTIPDVLKKIASRLTDTPNDAQKVEKGLRAAVFFVMVILFGWLTGSDDAGSSDEKTHIDEEGAEKLKNLAGEE